jgi:hypothetical protein
MVGSTATSEAVAGVVVTSCVRIEGTARRSRASRGTPCGARGAGHLDGLLRHEGMGWRVQGHRKPPGVGLDATSEGTKPASQHPGDSPSAEQRRSQAGPHSGFASDIWSRGQSLSPDNLVAFPFAGDICRKSLTTMPCYKSQSRKPGRG